MRIPILQGVYTDSNAEIRSSYPVNLIPVPKQSGVNEGYLRPAEGLETFVSGPGYDRGGIKWDGVMYRVMGSKLVSIAADGTLTTIGDVQNDTKRVSMAYGFDRLAIASNKKLFYYNKTTLIQVTDPDLGDVLDVDFLDGYFVTTDGTNIVVTELTDPTQVNPLKYGSSEADPDPIKAVKKNRNELYAINRHSCEVFDNVGGEFFPFQVIEGALITKGAVSTHACCVFEEKIAFVGSGVNEQIAVYLGENANTVKISTREIDKLLKNVNESDYEKILLEERMTDNHLFLYVHLPDRTVVFDQKATQETGLPVWFVLTSTLIGFSEYQAKGFVHCYGQWFAGNPNDWAVCKINESISSHYGNDVRWEFGTFMLYNEGNAAIMHELELVALTGRVALGKEPKITTSYSKDGVSWSQEREINVGKIGDRLKRLVWWQNGTIENFRTQRFKGDTQAYISFLRLEAQVEAFGE